MQKYYCPIVNNRFGKIARVYDDSKYEKKT